MGEIVAAAPQRPAESDLLPKPAVQVKALPNAEPIAFMPLAERIRRGIVPKHGFVSTGVAGGTLISGNGKMMVDLPGDPLSERISIRHERLIQPWKRPFEAPKIAGVLPEVRRLELEGKYREALELSFHASTDAGLPPGMRNHGGVSPFSMRIDIPEAGKPTNYLRTTDFDTGELKVYWTDSRGDWMRQTFVSRPDNVVVQYLTAPKGQTLNTTVIVSTGAAGRGGASNRPAGGGGVRYEQDFNERRLIVIGRFDPDTGNKGFAGVTRVVLSGGSARMENGNLVVSGAQSLTLLTRIEYFEDYSRPQVDALAQAVEKIPADYTALLARQRKIQSEVMGRVTMDLGGSAQLGLSSEELLVDQRLHQGYSPALVEKMVEMGRYWLYAEGTGDFPSMGGHLNINVNLQIAPAAIGAMPEAIETFAGWLEKMLPDSRKNAENIFGARGALFSVHPDQEQGVLYHTAYNWPHHYWISSGGWAYSPVWDYYLTTGDKEFLRKHLVPQLKELALFYEDYLKPTDANGNYIFVPSYSPENWPANTENSPSVINAVMDISVCRDVLVHLIEASEVLGTDANSVPKWKAMLAKMPPYLLDTDGALKEWAWPSIAENLDHRHASHLYGVWPADEVDPDRTPELAKAFWLSDRKRAQGNASGHGISHRSIAAARLKDGYLANMELKQFLEQGYVGPTLRGAHNPYTGPMPDQQGSIATLIMEMLLYSRPGVIEVLPAMPNDIAKGSVKGLMARTYAKVDDLSWDMATKTVSVTVTSRRKQDVTLIARYGIESINAPAGVLAAQPKPDETSCVLHLPEGKPVTVRMTIGSHKPSEWMDKIASK
jgi:alpha-L-fucosidase 2